MLKEVSCEVIAWSNQAPVRADW